MCHIIENMQIFLNPSFHTKKFYCRGSIDEAYCKSLYKLANKGNINTEKGTLSPIFALLKLSSEKMSNAHLHMVNKIQDLVKDVLKYNEEVHKKQKSVSRLIYYNIYSIFSHYQSLFKSLFFNLSCFASHRHNICIF